MRSLEKIINLIKKTGDKCIIINQESDDALVILPLEEYEKFLEYKSVKSEKLLTENKVVDKINRDIALKISEEKQPVGINEIDLEGELKAIAEKDGEEEKFYFEPVE